MNVLLCGRFDAGEREAWQAALGQAMPEARWLDLDEVRARPDAVDAAVVANPPPASLQGLPRLRLVQSLWAGVDRLLADPTLPEGVPLARMVDPMMNAAMAETALWAVLSLHRGFFDYASAQREGRWQPHDQRRADEVEVLVLGLGEMGRTAAARLLQQGYRVSGWSRGTARHRPEGLRCHKGAAALASLLARCEIVVNLLPLTPQTRGLIDAGFLQALPAGASLVNLARGAHVVEADLLAALDAGRLRHAVLDVFAVEPLPAGHPFWAHPRVTVLPHAAAMTDWRSAAEVVARNLRAARDGTPVLHLVERARGY